MKISNEHELNIFVEAEDSSQWSLVHHEDDQKSSIDDTKNHNWKSYDEPQFHHSIKPDQAENHFTIDPIFILSFIFPLNISDKIETLPALAAAMNILPL